MAAIIPLSSLLTAVMCILFVPMLAAIVFEIMGLRPMRDTWPYRSDSERGKPG
jgi:hypothetical protein